MLRAFLVLVIFLFGVLSAAALWQHGYLGILLPHFQSLYAGQVFADLVIALAIIVVWLVRDAQARGKNPLPWLLLTLLAGSFGPLLYLLERESSKQRQRQAPLAQ